MRQFIGAALLAMLAGCGGGGGGGGAIPFLKVAVLTPGAPQSGRVPINYTLKESPGATVSVSVEFSTDSGGSWLAATMAPGGDGLGGLWASPGGKSYLFFWDSSADLGAVDLSTCRIRITCSCGQAGETGDFRCNNLTNAAPVCTLYDFTSDQSGTCMVRYRLVDVNGDSCSIVCTWSLDGISFFPCTPGAGGDGVGGLSCDSLGIDYQFSWDCAADLGAVDVSTVQIRIACTDGTDPGLPVTSAPFRVNNVTNTPPDCVPAEIEGTQGGHVPIHYRLVDVNNDAVDLTVEFSQNGGATYNAATPGPGGDGNGNLAANSDGEDHVYVWNSNADAAAVDVNVLMRLTFSDGTDSHVCDTAEFRVNNVTNIPPRCEIEQIPGTKSGNVPVVYRLFDPDGDPATIAVT